ncbi:hypothetical protein ASD44_09685 [Mesorhizobium sp. Root554]|uniref:hypothetical protein n=1 Tax=unclassified Mesorhizobium TaxID=325217 RepID=UPI0006FCD114|nr:MULTISPECIES: hypothetical protein [unclassified Mesorhizobium]KQZ14313.1 hypothetical protein ASD27_09695 [Mesorhizobium sp. Root1471]KQZ36824.1 hypothetical protein ASD44_09685 [Mesorhizobium sp. Root554]
MPEPYWPKKRKGEPYKLSKALENRCFAHIRCRYCKVKRIYLIEDLIRLLGDIECDDVTDMHRWRCTNCGDLNIECRFNPISAAERQHTVFRRLVEVRYKKIPIWSDETVP